MGGKIAPGCTRAGDPEHGFAEESVVGRRSSGVPGLAGKEGAIRSHCESFTTLRSKADLYFFSLDSNFAANGNPPQTTVCPQALARRATKQSRHFFLERNGSVLRRIGRRILRD
jgi:hypothetical protein